MKETIVYFNSILQSDYWLFDITTMNIKSLSVLKIIYTWRYWPMELLYLPLTLYVFFIGSIKAGKLFYFASVNPKIALGGFACDSKYFITTHIPDEFRPKTFFVSKTDTIQKVLKSLILEDISFPLIVKPDIGECIDP